MAQSIINEIPADTVVVTSVYDILGSSFWYRVPEAAIIGLQYDAGVTVIWYPLRVGTPGCQITSGMVPRGVPFHHVRPSEQRSTEDYARKQ